MILLYRIERQNMEIEFYPSSKESEKFVPPPKPAKFYLPDWYKDHDGLNYKKLEFNDKGKVKNLSIKQCMPFLDSLSHGYIQETWTEIYVKNNTESIEYFYSSGPKIINNRGPKKIPNNDYIDEEFIWQIPWIPKVPKDYSILFTHPLNRIDLPFHTLSGIVDSDTFFHIPNGNYPFYIKNNFNGVIPIGTPMYQMIPIKRNSWDRVFHNFNNDETTKRSNVIYNKFYGAYKNLFWNKKVFK